MTVIVTPDPDHELDDITVTDEDGNPLDLVDQGGGKYTFTMPDGGVSVRVRFTGIGGPFFIDVPEDAWYYEAVKWAVKNGVTKGIGENRFGPDLPCTRAQIVTFLWRAAGCPEPKSTESPFPDLKPGAYYYKAVVWAAENGITTGDDTGRFDPDATCTRAQSVTFLFRALGTLTEGGTAFSDVSANSYYADAVAWAAATGVTTGIGEGLFAPNDECTRAQIVTFLWRHYVKD